MQKMSYTILLVFSYLGSFWGWQKGNLAQDFVLSDGSFVWLFALCDDFEVPFWELF